MEQQDKKRFITALAALSEIHNKELSQAVLDLYFGSLSDLGIDELERAIAVAVSTLRWFPKPVELREIVGKSAPKLEDLAAAEWTALLHALETNVHYSPPKLHPTTEVVLRQMGGWQTACQWERKHYDFKRRDFFELWQIANGNEPQMIEGADAMLAKIEAGRRDTTSPAALPEWRQ